MARVVYCIVNRPPRESIARPTASRISVNWSALTAAIAAYLVKERELGRIAADADIDSLTLSLVGGGHLLTADHDLGPSPVASVNKLVTAVVTNATHPRLSQ